ncbi:MAG TPA: LLM class flavin-dependent oxidoreductase, partial [Candidatus Limnocylindria bacterium]|nr:LLM class flavin-dependent oxidoreductase [Candidatus Limnocylindria bacterium]
MQLPSFSWPGGPAAIRPRLAEIARTAEGAGFASLWVMDHFFQLPAQTGWGGPDAPMLEAYTTLGYLAALTDRISLGAMVTGVVYRQPALLI